MPIATILACLLTEGSAEPLCEAAATLAARFDAHLTGLHTLEAIVVYPGVALYVPGPTFETFNAAQAAEGAAIGRTFEAVAARHGIRADWRVVRAASPDASGRMVGAARLADLVVMAPPRRGAGPPAQRHALSRVLREGGRPVLMCPPGAAADAIGARVLVAHPGAGGSVRAAFEALALMRAGASVRIVHVGDDAGGAATADLARAMARHGHDVSTAAVPDDGAGIPATLLREAADFGADLVVAGAYGRPRPVDLLFGARTDALIGAAGLPLLLST